MTQRGDRHVRLLARASRRTAPLVQLRLPARGSRATRRAREPPSTAPPNCPPSSTAPGTASGWSLIRLQRLDEAVAALKRNTELQPMSPYGWYQLARVHVDRQRAGRGASKIIRHLRGSSPRWQHSSNARRLAVEPPAAHDEQLRAAGCRRGARRVPGRDNFERRRSMQMTERQRQYWQKNLRITGDPAGDLVRRDLRRRLLRPRPRTSSSSAGRSASGSAAQGALVVYV